MNKCELCKNNIEGIKSGLVFALKNDRRIHLECLLEKIEIIIDYIQKENNND